MSDHSDNEAGFTLPEMLVALALLGLLATFTLGALQNISRARVVYERLDGLSATESIRRHFRHTLEQTRAVFIKESTDRPAILAFIGEASKLTLVAPSDPRLERGGLYRISYRLDRDTLSTTRELYTPNMKPAPNSAGAVELMRSVRELNFGYYGPNQAGSDPSWQERWIGRDSIPLKVRVQIVPDKLEINARPISIVVAIPTAN